MTSEKGGRRQPQGAAVMSEMSMGDHPLQTTGFRPWLNSIIGEGIHVLVDFGCFTGGVSGKISERHGGQGRRIWREEYFIGRA